MQTLATTLQQVQRAQAEAEAPAPVQPDPDLAARLHRLDELHASGLIDDAERRRRRDEILAEI
jgi:hypothetical protein